jgi:excisionase family DNA binding protein
MSNHDLSLAEFAALTGVSKETVWRNVRKGNIPGFRVGKQWRISRETVERVRNGGSGE